MKTKHFQVLVLVCIFLFISACGTYYNHLIKFHKLFVNAKISEADHILAKDKQAPKSRNKLLYYLNRGVTHHLMQQYKESNEFFEQAYIICQDFVANPVQQTFSFFINPTITQYKGEDHEILLIHYYKALNYLQLGDLSDALIECKRLNILLNELSDKYTSSNTYKRDAFMHILMGLIYQANHEYNNAFIAYRNAVEIYQQDYNKLFGLDIPMQLKKDLIYTAYKTGFYDQMLYYKSQFKLSYDPTEQTPDSDIICIWNNGLGPIKHEWALNFVVIQGAGGVINFVNEDLGLVFPFPISDYKDDNHTLSDLHLLRVAFPKYIERPLLYEKAKIQVHNNTYDLEKVQDINAISFKVLQERMLWECSKSLLRVALKKVAELQLKKQNEIMGTILGIVNFATEKADTRNWQSLPHSIYYTRIKVPKGHHQIEFQARSTKKPYAVHLHKVYINVEANTTVFYPVHTIDYYTNI